jgi:serine/threonine protein kinase
MLEFQERRKTTHIAEIVEGLQVLEARFPLLGGRDLVQPVRFITLLPYDRSLHDLIYGGQQYTLLEALGFFRQIVLGVSRVHRNGFCHRDLTPRNVLMTTSKYVVVSDFGSAKRMVEIPDATEYVAGERLYTSPEILAGLMSTEDLYASDVFALGALLFELINRESFGAGYAGFEFVLRHAPLCRAHLTDRKSREAKLTEILDMILGTVGPPKLFAALPPPQNATVRLHANRLFDGLTSLHSGRRTTDFDTILRRIDICTKSLSLQNKET